MADVTEQASYSSADEGVATVNATGTITAVGAGETEVIVTFEGKTATVAVSVEEPAPELQSITATPESVTLTEGDTQAIGVEAEYS
ncbi:hypothetical protein J18TS1_12600 [Oceanobacillus oncorhynchi subsp. incaldanensis]|uniref:Ig-like domain-containing protein n=1 Tax=Oceanobacillus oncorhynchi TaxID=545501 RepID=UPI001B08C58E|nr:Ig-like domain-containing protein [Oceanobacillus oncorhynchi]GIO18160.1 hypothetical protein J18TS1_12600 [Oceanobacillus oncorhynchi subsp. incaldanensis]